MTKRTYWPCCGGSPFVVPLQTFFGIHLAFGFFFVNFELLHFGFDQFAGLQQWILVFDIA
jgi:hypothetical protein